MTSMARHALPPPARQKSQNAIPAFPNATNAEVFRNQFGGNTRPSGSRTASRAGPIPRHVDDLIRFVSETTVTQRVVEGKRPPTQRLRPPPRELTLLKQSKNEAGRSLASKSSQPGADFFQPASRLPASYANFLYRQQARPRPPSSDDPNRRRIALKHSGKVLLRSRSLGNLLAATSSSASAPSLHDPADIRVPPPDERASSAKRAAKEWATVSAGAFLCYNFVLEARFF